MSQSKVVLPSGPIATLAPYTIDLLRLECRMCREMEDRLLNASSLYSKMKQTIDTELKNSPDNSGFGSHEVREDQQELRHPGFYLIKIGERARRKSEDDKSDLRADLGEARRSVRDIFGGLNRIGLAVLMGEACLYSISVCEGRYLAAVWLRWSEYIKFRREGKGRERVYAAAEHLVWLISQVMLHDLLVDHDEETQSNYNAYWDFVSRSTKPLSEYYSSAGLRQFPASFVELKDDGPGNAAEAGPRSAVDAVEGQQEPNPGEAD